MKKPKEFTLRQYKKNESINDHSENALQLVKKFGTEEEISAMTKLLKLHERQGYLTHGQLTERYELSNKYYKLLKIQYSYNDIQGTPK